MTHEFSSFVPDTLRNRPAARLILKLQGVQIAPGMALRIFLNHPDPKPDTPHDNPCHVRTISSLCCATRQVGVRFDVDATACFRAADQGGPLRVDLVDAPFHEGNPVTPCQVHGVDVCVEP